MLGPDLTEKEPTVLMMEDGDTVGALDLVGRCIFSDGTCRLSRISSGEV